MIALLGFAEIVIWFVNALMLTDVTPSMLCRRFVIVVNHRLSLGISTSDTPE